VGEHDPELRNPVADMRLLGRGRPVRFRGSASLRLSDNRFRPSPPPGPKQVHEGLSRYTLSGLAMLLEGCDLASHDVAGLGLGRHNPYSASGPVQAARGAGPGHASL